MDRQERSVKGDLQVTKGNLRGGVSGRLHQLGGFVLDFLYPPLCVNCNAGIARADLICATCWGQLRPITKPLCPRLGVPFEFDMGSDAISAQAIASPPEFERARSAFVHTGVAKKLISRLKFGDRPDLSVFCARMMASAGRELFEPFEGYGRPVLVPVPLHRHRQWHRRYNQSTQLARALAKLVGLDVDPLCVMRTKSTKPQIGLSAEQRAANVAGAFKTSPDMLERLNNRPVIIVDDVITTGSTINAMTRALKKGGVAHIDVISFTRVVFGADDG